MKAEIQAETVPAPRRRSLTTRYFQQFADRSFEHQYRKESFEAGHKWLRFTFSLVVSIVVFLNIYYWAHVAPNEVIVSGFFGDRYALGAALANASMITPLVVCPLTYLAMFTRLYNEHTYISFLAMCSLGTFLSFSWPVHLREIMSLSNGETFEVPFDRGGNCSSVTLANLVANVAERTTSHVAMMLICDFAVVALNPDLKSTGAPLPCRTVPPVGKLPLFPFLPYLFPLTHTLRALALGRQLPSSPVQLRQTCCALASFGKYTTALGSAHCCCCSTCRCSFSAPSSPTASAILCGSNGMFASSCKQPRTRESSSSPPRRSVSTTRGSSQSRRSMQQASGHWAAWSLRMLAEEDTCSLAAKWTITQSAARVARTAKRRCTEVGQATRARAMAPGKVRAHRTSRAAFPPRRGAQAKRARMARMGVVELARGERRLVTHAARPTRQRSLCTSTMSHLRPRSERVRPTSAPSPAVLPAVSSST